MVTVFLSDEERALMLSLLALDIHYYIFLTINDGQTPLNKTKDILSASTMVFEIRSYLLRRDEPLNLNDNGYMYLFQVLKTIDERRLTPEMVLESRRLGPGLMDKFGREHTGQIQQGIQLTTMFRDTTPAAGLLPS